MKFTARHLIKFLLSIVLFAILLPRLSASEKDGMQPVIAVDTINGDLSEEMRKELSSSNITVKELRSPITTEQFNGVTAMLVYGSFRDKKLPDCYEEDEIAAISKFVTGGGTLIGAGVVWPWVYKAYGNMPLEDHPLNQLGSALGFVVKGQEGGEIRISDAFKLKNVGELNEINIPKGVFSSVEIDGRSQKDKRYAAAGAQRGNGKICIFGHQALISANPKIVTRIVKISAYGYRAEFVKNEAEPTGATEHAPNRTQDPPHAPAEKEQDVAVVPSKPPGAPVQLGDATPSSLSQVDANPIDQLSAQAPNAIAWVSSQLEVAMPPELRENLILLRENILDEKAGSQVSEKALNAAAELCSAMLAAIDVREAAQVAAKLRIVKAEANAPLSNQALETRRNYKMSWPQFHREVEQREVLKEQKSDTGVVELHEQQVKWTERAIIIRRNLDTLYRNFRNARRGQ